MNRLAYHGVQIGESFLVAAALAEGHNLVTHELPSSSLKKINEPKDPAARHPLSCACPEYAESIERGVKRRRAHLRGDIAPAATCSTLRCHVYDAMVAICARSVSEFTQFL